MEAMKVAMSDGGIDAELVTIPYILDNALELSGCAIVCFNSAKCFDDELIKLLGVCSVIDDIDLTLISNDVRLGFKVYEQAKSTIDRLEQRMMVDSDINVRILTNASIDFENYIHEICDWPYAALIPIYFSALFTLPSFMPGARTSVKDKDVVFTCMHFKDYSDYRKNDLIRLREYFGERLVLSGDMSGMIVNGQEVPSIVTDTATVWQWYEHTKTTPVLLEQKYERYGVLPNRISESLVCGCLPIMHIEFIEHYKNIVGLPIPIVINDFNKYMQVIDNYCGQYFTPEVKKQIECLQISLAYYKTQLVMQFLDLYA
jgi:hypothetical protein